MRKIRGRGCKQLQDDIQEKKRYWNFKEEALYRTFGGGELALEAVLGLS